MQKELPAEFIQKMQRLLGDEAADFFSSFDREKTYGLRKNLLKPCEQPLPFTLKPVPWAPSEGFYAEPAERPGKHPLHDGGAYYIQEPSAMSVISLLDPQPGERICDLCAAPGGKSTQIAGRLQGQGLLVANEIIPSRAKILSQNIERCGVRNAFVCNEPPDRMASHFPLFFDRIVVDAPCSGEGMFRKDDAAIEEWSARQEAACAERQKMILQYADEMLLPGGILVYSTCTFSPEENEEVITWFLQSHPEYTLEDWRTPLALASSQPDSAGLTDGYLPKTLRLWPHRLQGEGHFAARLRKGRENSSDPLSTYAASTAGTVQSGSSRYKTSKKSRKKKNKQHISSSGHTPEQVRALDDFYEFCTKYLIPSAFREYPDDALLFFGNSLYLLPPGIRSTDGIRVVRAGLHLGNCLKNRFEPAHALAMALSPSDVRNSVSCSLEEAEKYLRGEMVVCPPEQTGWTLVCFQGVSLGWGKARNGIVKNHYPKGLRRNQGKKD